MSESVQHGTNPVGIKVGDFDPDIIFIGKCVYEIKTLRGCAKAHSFIV